MAWNDNLNDYNANLALYKGMAAHAPLTQEQFDALKSSPDGLPLPGNLAGSQYPGGLAAFRPAQDAQMRQQQAQKLAGLSTGFGGMLKTLQGNPVTQAIESMFLGPAVGGITGLTAAGVPAFTGASELASGLAGSAIGGGTAAATGGNILQGALKGGASAAIGSGLMNNAGSITSGLGLTGPETSGQSFSQLMGFGAPTSGMNAGDPTGSSWLSDLGKSTGISDAYDYAKNGISSLFGSGAGSASGFNTGIAQGFNAAGDSVGMNSPEMTGFGTSASGVMPSGLASPGMNLSGGGGMSSYAAPLAIGASLIGGAGSIYANDKAQKDLLAAEANAQGAIAPYQASGVAANSKLSDLLGTSSNTGASGYGSLTTPFTASNLENDPGYQFQLQQGNQALARQQAAAGNLDSGAAMKAAQEFGQGLAGTTFNNAFQRDQATKGQQYGMFSGQAGQGQNAANTSGQISQNIGNAQANNQIASSSIMNQTLSSLLSGSGARTIKGYNPQTGQPIYGM